MSTKQEYNCVFCKDAFENKEDLQEHFRKHGDPKFKNRFEVDTQASDDKSKEKVELVSCDVCSQVFPTISKAITHKHKVHPDHDAKYFCPWCGKLFTMKHLYNVHVQSNHGNQEKTEDKPFQCETCNVDFYVPSAMINHNKFFHRQDTDLPDVGQSKKVKYYKQEVVPIYYCAFCGEEYENKVNLIKHMSDDHGDENQIPDEVLKCPMCDAVFYHLDAYEIHLTFHSSEDTYSVKNPEYSDLLDYSIETVPPIIEKVEILETDDHNQDTDAESTMNAVGIDKFLESAMDQSEDSNPVKAKKHKKRKKSKKSAITLDEFLSMNKDVFGEGLDFQGIEEVPTRVVKKQLKNNRKSSNASVTSAELAKLKKAGIVIKRNVGRNPIIKGIKVATSMPNKTTLNKSVFKNKQIREIETSSEVLTKLMNQSNNQIKIVKKLNPGTAANEPMHMNDFPIQEMASVSDNINENANEYNHNIDERKCSSIPKLDGDITKDLSSSKSEALSATTTADNPFLNNLNESNINPDVVKDSTENILNNDNTQNISAMSDSNHSPQSSYNKTCQKVANPENIENHEFDQVDSDTEYEGSENKFQQDSHVKNDKPIDNSLMSTVNSNSRDNVFTTSASSLSTLKHLSHLITVKPVGQNKNNISTEHANDTITESVNDSHQNENMRGETSNLILTNDKTCLSKPKSIVDTDPTMDALKTLSKNITIKSLSINKNIDESESEDYEIDENEKFKNNLKLENVSGNKNITIKKMKVETSEPNPDEKKMFSGKPLMNKSAVGTMPSKRTSEKADNSLTVSNANILKRLTNITTKPINNKNDCVPVKQTNMAKKIIQTEEKQEEIIEIFDIDDSEDEDENSKQPQPSQNLLKSRNEQLQTSKNPMKTRDAWPQTLQNPTKPKDERPQLPQNLIKPRDGRPQPAYNPYKVREEQPQPCQNSTKSMDALKNLSKNITIKSVNQSFVQKNIKIEKEDNNSQNKFKEETNIDTLINMQNRNMEFKTVLQGLSKNITIKSRNPSPSQFNKSQEYNTQGSKVLEDNEASDSDSCSGNIKISELDKDMSDNEDDSERTENCDTDLNHPIVESPNESISDHDDLNEDGHDFEADIKVSTVQKCNKTMNSTINSVCFKNLKNINKNITIKSLNKNSDTTDNDDTTKQTQIHDNVTTHIQNKQLPKKQTKQEPQSDNMSVNRISRTTDQTLNKKLSAMNQVTAVNKEVTVKTIQTKTVIQEITTTVTKTIKTVNQTMKQEVRNAFQTSTPMVPQRIRGIRPGQSKNLQGVVIRHALPVLGPRANNMVSQIRPASTVVRPSKQIVPIRAGINLARPNNPRMVVGKKVTASPSPNKQAIGKPLKISPTAMATATSKRSNTEDVSGPFSCFKKPKESLIPVSDVPTFANSRSEATAQFTSASHTSSTNFTSTTQIVKGNSVATAKQMKSEVNTTSQQLSRLSNTSGLKIMSSQHKQSQVQEKNDSSTMKRTTLEAIQRLQKQGLLVKKPRVDETHGGSSDSDHDGDHNVCSTDEHDE